MVGQVVDQGDITHPEVGAVSIANMTTLQDTGPLANSVRPVDREHPLNKWYTYQVYATQHHLDYISGCTRNNIRAGLDCKRFWQATSEQIKCHHTICCMACETRVKGPTSAPNNLIGRSKQETHGNGAPVFATTYEHRGSMPKPFVGGVPIYR